MNLTLKKRNNDKPNYELIGKIAKKIGLHEKLIELLFSRGFDSEEKISRFLEPDFENFYDPFLMKGMREAVDRINIAIENDEKVVVYGDYDADGVCASAILSLFLSGAGLNIYTHIPNRSSDGYGLSVESLEKIIDAACPDLIITCDCGISAYEEVEYAMDLGVDVIVTDHHEVSDKIPSCIVVNPKQSDCEYPIDFLCGAGVALKLVQAIGGIDKAKEYFDLAAVATVADLVPLLDENRLIVQSGLKRDNLINRGLKALLKNQQLDSEVSSSDIAYKIAPRINAAGRMGDAYRAFELLITKDVSRINSIIEEINTDNVKRKELCDAHYIEAIRIIKSENLIDNKAIVLCHPDWEKGITGILAAQIAGDFKRPTFILVKSGELYKGTCRSIRDVNIYELLASVSSLLTEFGGHSQAAGFSILPENIDEFKKQVNNYLKNFDDSCFLPCAEYDLDIDISDIGLSFAKSLVKIEPVGNGNAYPVFRTTVGKLDVSPCKSNYNHTNIVTETGLPILAFNFYNENQFLMGTSEKDLLLEVQLSNFGGRESRRGILRGVKIDDLFINPSVARAAYIKYLAYPYSENVNYTEYDKKDLYSLFDGDIFGTLVICGSEKSYRNLDKEFRDKFVLNEFMYSTSKNNYSRITVSPIFDSELMLSNYGKIIFVDSPPSDGVIAYINSKTSAKVLVPKESNVKEIFDGLDVSRETFGRYFDILRRNADLSAQNIFSFFRVLASRVADINVSQFVFCVTVFNELKFFNIKRGEFSLQFNQGVKSELGGSAAYNRVREVLDNEKS